jgi:PAS domain S-box-containing protein
VTKKTLRTRFIVLVVAAIVPLFCLSILNAMHSAEDAMEHAKGNLQFAASLAAASQERVADSARQVLMAIASMPGMQDGKSFDCDRYFSSLIRRLPEYVNLGILGLDGYTRCHALGSDKKAFLGDRAYFRNAITQRRFVAGPYALGRLVGRPVMTFAQPVIGADDKVTGVIFASVDLAEMAKLIAGLQLPPGAALGIHDRDGTLLAGKPALPIQIGQKVSSPVLQEAVKTWSTAVREGPDGAGRDRLWAFLPSSPHAEAAVFVSVSLDRDLIVGPSRRQLWLELVALALTAFLGGWLAWLMGGRAIVKPTTELLEATRQVQQGRLDVRIPIIAGDDAGEFSRIAAGFNLMAESLQTQREALEAELARSQAAQEKLQDAQRLGRIGYWQSNLDTHEVWWSDEVYDVLGMDRALLGNTFEQFLQWVHPDDREAYGGGRDAIVQADLPRSIEYRVVTSAGEVRWIHQFGRRHVNAEGEHGRRRAGVLQDITERKLAEESLRKLSLAVEQSPESIIITNLDAQIEYVNEAFVNVTGYSREDVIGHNPRILRSGKTPRETYAAMWKNLNEGRPWRGELYNRRKDGMEYTEFMIVTPIHQADGRITHYVAIKEDITEKKRVTEALRASELHLRQITDTVPALMADLDLEQRFRFHNKAYEEVFGLSFEQINGHTLAEVLGPQTYGVVQAKVEEVLRGYPVRYERVITTPQGDHRDYAMNFLPRYGEGADEGKVIGFFSLGTDITELKRIDRMKSEFVSTVSHELRTPLTSIRGSLGLISGGVAGELPVAVKNLVGIAKNNCERLIRLINDILDIEKIESGKMLLDLQVVGIKQLVQQALAANEGFAGQHRVTMRLQAPDEPLQVRIDSDRLTQVLTNLLSNAVKFSPPESAVEVKVSRVGQQVRVEVADHGPGIPEEFRDRIFQKFSQADTSDARQKGGTGLGLNISKALIEKMGGHIGFSSEAGAGTTFFFEVPEWQNPAPLPLPPPSGARGASSRPRILICEDDLDVARLISMMLGKAGFEADMSHSAAQALACLKRNSYDAVTVDLKLPDQHGAAFISALRGDESTRNLPVVVISATAEQGQLQFNRKPLTVSDWLEKPIDENLLILSVRRAVAGLHSGKPRILHVEDDPDIQEITAAMAQDFATFEFAATLDQARARLREHRFDLVLLDLTLGNDSGWGLFEEVDALDPRPPVIVFSSSDVDPADGQKAEAVLVKTHTSYAELVNTIQHVLQIPGDPGPTRPQALS